MGLARALGGGLGSKDVALEKVRTIFRQSHGGTGHLHSVKVLILIRRQGRIQVGHQRGDCYLITYGIGGPKQVPNGFVYEVGAGASDNQSTTLHPDLESISTYRPAAVLKSTPPWWRISRASSSLSPLRMWDILTRFGRCASSSECDGKRLEIGLRWGLGRSMSSRAWSLL